MPGQECCQVLCGGLGISQPWNSEYLQSCAGSGKSTLLDMITGNAELDNGIRVEGDTTVVGYFQQHPPAVNPKLKIIDHVASQAQLRHVFICLCHRCTAPQRFIAVVLHLR